MQTSSLTAKSCMIASGAPTVQETHRPFQSTCTGCAKSWKKTRHTRSTSKRCGARGTGSKHNELILFHHVCYYAFDTSISFFMLEGFIFVCFLTNIMNPLEMYIEE